ncbi:unnamed protein product [Mytilus coruscus]|uniref:Uncharacterized protein n=1 Tax=Mytilus coruscus TaxID=42192 RepID=A0A6J8CDG1_MYTCO|nr:unnamed protein product [Mytilus coruscus]
MALTYHGSNIVKVFNTGGSKVFEVKTPTYAFDVAYISDDNTLAVTLGYSGAKCITIIDIQNKQIKKEISVESNYYGIAMKDNTFICSAAEKGIQLVNPYNNSKINIVRQKYPMYCYIAHYDDTIYHTNYQTNSVTCYDEHGKLQWTFKNENVLTTAHGISVDNDGNVYVVGQTSTNVVVLSADGQQHKEILTASDGLTDPCSIDYCKVQISY